MHREEFIDLSSCKTAGKGKRFAVLLLDVFLLFLISFALYAFVGNPIVDALPSTKENSIVLSSRSDEMKAIIEETGLQTVGSDGTLVSVSTKSEDYLVRFVKTSCYVHEIPYKTYNQGAEVKEDVAFENTLLYVLDGAYVNDEVLSYYLTFRSTHEEEYQTSFDPIDRKGVYETFFLTEENSSYFTLSGEGQFTFTKEATNRVLDFLLYQNEVGREEASALVLGYQRAINSAVKEVEESYVPYIETNAEFMKAFNTYIRSTALVFVLCYLVSFLICFLLLPLLLRTGQTLGMRVFSLAYLRTDMMEMKAWNYLVKGVVTFLIDFAVIFLMAAFSGQVQLLSAPLFLGINLFQICVFSFLLMIVSTVMMFVMKDHQTLEEYASCCYVISLKDREEQFYQQQEKKDERKR